VEGEKTGEAGASTRATSAESEIRNVLPLSSLTVEEPRTRGSLKVPKILEAPVEPIDAQTCLDLPLPPYADEQVTLNSLAVEPASESADCPPCRSTRTAPERNTPSGCDEDDQAVAIASLFSAGPS